jgi:hypothetical protein
MDDDGYEYLCCEHCGPCGANNHQECAQCLAEET